MKMENAFFMDSAECFVLNVNQNAKFQTKMHPSMQTAQ